MKKYDVYFLTTTMAWEDIEAESEEDAIKQCTIPDYYDSSDGEPTRYVAIEREEDL